VQESIAASKYKRFLLFFFFLPPPWVPPSNPPGSVTRGLLCNIDRTCNAVLVPLISLTYFFYLSTFLLFLCFLDLEMHTALVASTRSSRLELKITACMRLVTKKSLIPISANRVTLKVLLVSFSPLSPSCPSRRPPVPSWVVLGLFVPTVLFRVKAWIETGCTASFPHLGRGLDHQIGPKLPPPNLFLFLQVLTYYTFSCRAFLRGIPCTNAALPSTAALLYSTSAVGISRLLFLYVWPFPCGDSVLCGNNG